MFFYENDLVLENFINFAVSRPIWKKKNILILGLYKKNIWKFLINIYIYNVHIIN